MHNMNCLASLLPGGLLRFLSFNSTLIFCALIIVLIVAVFIWAAVVRKPRTRKSTRHHWKSKNGASEKTGGEVTSANADSAPRPRRRHKRRRPRKPLNPTLAETRGLPPVRDKQSTPPPSY